MGRIKGQQKASAKVIQQVERQREALELRKQGLSFDEIARRTGYWKTRKGAHRAVISILNKMKQENASELIKLELERLDQWLLALAARTLGGDTRAIDTALRISERRCKLQGVEVQKIEVKRDLDLSGLSDEEIAIVNAILGKIGASSDHRSSED